MLPVPPIERQQEFDAVLAKVTSLQAANEVALARGREPV